MKQPVSITVCIPCYKYHIPALKRCLDSIQKQTVLPQAVIVSCSSSTQADIYPHISAFDDYSFPLKIITTPNRKNAAENRNISAEVAEKDSKFLSFFDADDVMHPQRLEAICNAIQTFPETELILHNYSTHDKAAQFSFYPQFSFYQNTLAKAPSGCAIHTLNWKARIHHSQVSVSTRVWRSIKFNETAAYERKEDAVFCGNCLTLPGIQSVYISDSLSNYLEEGATHYD